MLLIIGIVIGLVLGLTGSGGSVFAVPLLIVLAGVSIEHAIGLSLATVAASAIFGTVKLRTKQPVMWLPAIILSLSGVLAAPVGQWAGSQLSVLVLTLCFVVLASTIAILMWRKAMQCPDSATITRASDLSNSHSGAATCRLSPNGQFKLKPRCMIGLVIGGLIVGLLSGLLGVGGGFIIIPLLLFLSQVTMQQAVSTSLVVISVISTVGFISYLFIHHSSDKTLAYPLLSWLVGGGIIGMFLGQILTNKIADARLQKSFAIALFLMALMMLLSPFILVK